MSDIVRKDNYDLQAEWDRVFRSYLKTTGADLTKSSNLSPDEVVGLIKAKEEKDEADGAKFRVAKDVIGKLLTTIETLGSIAAQGAGMVFGPSTICFNAVSYLIVAGRNYRNIFSSLTELFSRISDVLERFSIYLRMKDDVDVALKRIIHQLLLSFVSICELSVKVLHGNKVLKFLKVFAFNEDDGIKCELEKLKILAEKESQMKGTLTLESVKANERKVIAGFAETKEGLRGVRGDMAGMSSTLGTIAESEKKREALSVAEKQFEKIKGALGNPEESYRDIYQSFLTIKLPNTGEWLRREPSFMSWADQQSDSEPIFCISGNEGYGKSVLMSTVIQALRKKYPAGQDDFSRTSIAYYYFQKDVKSSQSSDRGHQSIEKALKALALQIAQNDPVYQKHLATSIKTFEDLSEVEHLWRNLFTKFSQIDATFFLLLDGIDQIDERHENILLQLLRDVQARPRVKGSLRIRLFLSTRVDKLRETRKFLEKPFSSIDLARKNGDDIQHFVKFKMDKMKILSVSSTQVQGLRDEIFADLTENAQGDFVNVDLLLKEIGSMQRPFEIRAVLAKAKAGENLSDTIARKIERCNELLGERDIQDLNELLTWVINSCRPLTLRELEAVLYLKNKTSGASMEPLREQIQDRYSTFFRVSDEADLSKASGPVVTLVSDSIIDHFRKSTKTVDIEDSPADESINESEVKIIKRFLESVCDPDLFTRFGFEGFFKRKLAKNTAVIAVDLHAAPLKLLMDCLLVINDEVDEMTEPLVDHAALWFPEYLQQVDLSSADPTTKTAIGKQLLPLFTSNRHIERWWKKNDFGLRYRWLYNDNYIDQVLNWLKDAAVIKELTNEEKEWIKSLTSNSDLDVDLLMPLTKFLASKWLQSTDWGTVLPFICVHGYIIKIKSRKNPDLIHRLDNDPNPIDIKPSDIYEAAEWAAKQLEVNQPSYQWLCYLGQTFASCEYWEDAIRQYKVASAMTSESMKADLGLAEAYMGQEKWQLAIQTLTTLGEALQSDISRDDNESLLRNVFRYLASCYANLGEDTKAMEIYQKVLQDRSDDYDTAVDILRLQNRQGKFTETIEFLQMMRTHTDIETGLDRLTQFYHEFAGVITYHDTIFEAAEKVNCLDFIKKCYETAIEAAKAKQVSVGISQRQQMVLVYNLLSYYFADLLFQHHVDESERMRAIYLWEQIRKPSEISEDTILDYQLLTAQKLSLVYYEKMKEAAPDSEIVVENINKLIQLSINENFKMISSYYLVIDSKMLLGRYYQSINRKDEAKRYLRGAVKTALDLLSDDDVANDWQGYTILGRTLMYFGDDTNALAAWSLILPTTADSETIEYGLENAVDAVSGYVLQGPSSETVTYSRANPLAIKQESIAQDAVPSTSILHACELENPGNPSNEADLGSLISPPKLKGPIGLSCDGRCGTNWTFADDIYVCKDCLNTEFDFDCLRLLQDGQLFKKGCNPKHEFLHVPKFDMEEARRVGKERVRVDGEIVLITEWLRGIRKDWGLLVETDNTEISN